MFKKSIAIATTLATLAFAVPAFAAVTTGTGNANTGSKTQKSIKAPSKTKPSSVAPKMAPKQKPTSSPKTAPKTAPKR